MGLELLAISLGLGTFQKQLKGRLVVVHSDNSGSEVGVMACFGFCIPIWLRVLQVALRRGTARKLDHAQLVHHQWLHAAVHGMELRVKRVATHDNIADLPSRGEFGILREHGAVEVLACQVLLALSPCPWLCAGSASAVGRGSSAGRLGIAAGEVGDGQVAYAGGQCCWGGCALSKTILHMCVPHGAPFPPV